MVSAVSAPHRSSHLRYFLACLLQYGLVQPVWLFFKSQDLGPGPGKTAVPAERMRQYWSERDKKGRWQERLMRDKKLPRSNSFLGLLRRVVIRELVESGRCPKSGFPAAAYFLQRSDLLAYLLPVRISAGYPRRFIRLICCNENELHYFILHIENSLRKITSSWMPSESCTK